MGDDAGSRGAVVSCCEGVPGCVHETRAGQSPAFRAVADRYARRSWPCGELVLCVMAVT
jgi:hypothetical protein